MEMLLRNQVDQSIGGDPERRGDERSETPRSGGSLPIERAAGAVPLDSEVPVRHARRRFTTVSLARTASGSLCRLISRAPQDTMTVCWKQSY
jgi:hypothetical protein